VIARQTSSSWPANNAAAGLPAPTKITGKYVSSISIALNQITITFANEPNIANKTLILTAGYGISQIDESNVMIALAKLFLNSSVKTAHATHEENQSDDKKSDDSNTAAPTNTETTITWTCRGGTLPANCR
jgi:hypothetical protein